MSVLTWGQGILAPRYFACTVAFCAGVALFLKLIGMGGTFTENLVISLCIGLSTHLAGALFTRILNGFPTWTGYLALAAAMITGIYTGSILGFYFIGVVPEPAFGPFPWLNQTVVAGIFFGAIGSGLLYLIFRASRAELLSARLEAGVAASELKLLQAQIEPHFLFNTLANVRSLIETDPQNARALLDVLIVFLRSALALSRRSSATLGDELSLLTAYLEIHRARMSPRLGYSVTCEPDLKELPFPPLLVQPLVENAIRHGLEPMIDGGRVEVTAAREGERLIITVSDNGVGSAVWSDEGIGIMNVRERLRSLYGSTGELRIDAPPGKGVMAALTIPMRAICER